MLNVDSAAFGKKRKNEDKSFETNKRQSNTLSQSSENNKPKSQLFVDNIEINRPQFSTFHRTEYFYSNQEYIQSIINNTKNDINVYMVKMDTLHSRKQGTIINQLIEVRKKFQQDMEDVYEFKVRPADFFCYDPESSGLNKEVCIDSHHIHVYVANLNINLHAKFCVDKEMTFVKFTFKELLYFDPKKTRYPCSNTNRTIAVPNDLLQILSYLKQYFNDAIREDRTYFEGCY